MSKNKKTWLASSLLVLFVSLIIFLAGAKVSQADSLWNPLKDIVGEGTGAEMIVNFIGSVLEKIYAMVIGLAMIFIVLGGLMYMFAGVKESQATLGKNMVTGAIIGIIVVLGAGIFMNEISEALGVQSDIFTLPEQVLPSTTGTAMSILEKVINLLLALLGMLAVIGIIIGGVIMLTSGGNEDKYKLGMKTLTYAILGLAVALGSMIIVKQLETLFN